MNFLIKYALSILFHKILYQNEISLDITGIQVVFRIETALKY